MNSYIHHTCVNSKTQIWLATLGTQNQLWICPHWLDVQGTNVCNPLYRKRNHFVGCWIANGWTTCSRFVGCGDIEVLRSTNNTKKPTTLVPGDWRRTETQSNKNKISHPIPIVSGTEMNMPETLINCLMWNPRRMNAEEVLITQEDDEFIFPVAYGAPKLSGRDNEFREVVADFGQSNFGQSIFGHRVWPANFGQSIISQSIFWCCCVVVGFGVGLCCRVVCFLLVCVVVLLCCCVLFCVVAVCCCVVVCFVVVLLLCVCGGCVQVSPPDPPPPDPPPSAGPPLRRTAQNFALFFSLSRHSFYSFLPLLLVFFVEFCWCF